LLLSYNQSIQLTPQIEIDNKDNQDARKYYQNDFNIDQSLDKRKDHKVAYLLKVTEQHKLSKKWSVGIVFTIFISGRKFIPIESPYDLKPNVEIWNSCILGLTIYSPTKSIQS